MGLKFYADAVKNIQCVTVLLKLLGVSLQQFYRI